MYWEWGGGTPIQITQFPFSRVAVFVHTTEIRRFFFRLCACTALYASRARGTVTKYSGYPSFETTLKIKQNWSLKKGGPRSVTATDIRRGRFQKDWS